MTEEIDPIKAIDFIARESKNYAQAYADANHLERFLKTVKRIPDRGPLPTTRTPTRSSSMPAGPRSGAGAVEGTGFPTGP